MPAQDCRVSIILQISVESKKNRRILQISLRATYSSVELLLTMNSRQPMTSSNRPCTGLSIVLLRKIVPLTPTYTNQLTHRSPIKHIYIYIYTFGRTIIIPSNYWTISKFILLENPVKSELRIIMNFYFWTTWPQELSLAVESPGR